MRCSGWCGRMSGAGCRLPQSGYTRRRRKSSAEAAPPAEHGPSPRTVRRSLRGPRPDRRAARLLGSPARRCWRPGMRCSGAGWAASCEAGFQDWERRAPGLGLAGRACGAAARRLALRRHPDPAAVPAGGRRRHPAGRDGMAGGGAGAAPGAAAARPAAGGDAGPPSAAAGRAGMPFAADRLVADPAAGAGVLPREALLEAERLRIGIAPGPAPARSRRGGPGSEVEDPHAPRSRASRRSRCAARRSCAAAAGRPFQRPERRPGAGLARPHAGAGQPGCRR